MLMGYGRNALEVKYITIRITKRFGIYYFCVGLDSGLEGCEVVDIDDCITDALSSQRVGDQVIGTTIEVVGSHDVIASLNDVLQRVGDGGSTRGYCETCHTTLKGSHTILEHTLSGVGKTAIDVTCIAEAETVGSML